MPDNLGLGVYTKPKRSEWTRFIRDPRQQQAKALTYRQREVLQLLAEGLSMKQAAAELNITTRTIAFQKYRIMEKNGQRT